MAQIWLGVAYHEFFRVVSANVAVYIYVFLLFVFSLLLFI